MAGAPPAVDTFPRLLSQTGCADPANPALPSSGLVPYTVLLSVYMLANFLVLLCWTLHVNSEAWISAAIVITNMGVSIYMFVVGAQPGLQNHIWGAAPVWNQTAWTILIVELGVIALAFTLPFFLAARRRDFI